MAKGLKKITTVDELDKIIKKSNKKPVFIFKHDVTIAESEEAYHIYIQFIDENQEDLMFAMVDVREYIEVSEEIVEILEINHETPQLMLVMEEEVVWDDQQNNITFDILTEVVNEFIFI
ncbi:bacillithiol system protein YtxJ [Natronincola peptidivorans]|uniref:Bacillithiol system protein YtxJ n=1 Tax=Natronincola peptidivorans TaxID=426128 RepID=A0A1I0DKR7_9FIRM|nr:bacillithiol system redox-active protein YtxJ [Natronincola peptidivorans]SET33099.1 bacillithiol system protein YtxJ [Natronincola peptidivorans]